MTFRLRKLTYTFLLFMNNLFYGRGLAAIAVAGALSITSCVDHDYDLSKDIDLTVNVGGDLTLPPSSTETYTMGQMLDLDENSSIKPDGELYGLAQGDYVLSQDGDVSPSSVHIDPVTLHDLNCTSNYDELSFIGSGAQERIYTTLVDLTNTLTIRDDNVDPQVTAIKSADVNIRMDVTIDFEALDNYHGSWFVEPGFEIEFPKGWTIVNNLNDGCGVVGGNKLVINNERVIPDGTALNLSVTATRIDLSDVPAGQGLYARGHFLLNATIISNGKIGINNGTLSQGDVSRVRLYTTPKISTAVISALEGTIDPDIKIDPTNFNITGVPDFLKTEGNNLDIENPRINLIVENASPVDVDLNAILTGYYNDGTELKIGIGDKHGTAPVMIKGNGKTGICLSRLGTGANTAAGEVNVKVPELGNLISSIPERIAMSDINAKVPQNKTYNFTLGKDYGFTVNYKAVIPLAFGPDLKFTYSSKADGWGDDLDKYNFHKVIATIDVENSTPLNLVPHVTGLDKSGAPVHDITATVEGMVTAGSTASPSKTKLVVVLTSRAANIGSLGGVEFDFEATSAPDFVGVPLNEAQAMKFTKILLQLEGGIDIDLN